MAESLRALLLRHAEELADCLAEQLAAAPRTKARVARARKREAPLVAPEPKEMTPERAARAEMYVRRVLGS